MSRKTENTGFICDNCGNSVKALSNGSFRNHCPFCLCSKHVDEIPGDRASNCGGIMKAIALKINSKKGYQIIHKCIKCGKEQPNMIAEDALESDDMNLVRKLPTM